MKTKTFVIIGTIALFIEIVLVAWVVQTLWGWFILPATNFLVSYSVCIGGVMIFKVLKNSEITLSVLKGGWAEKEIEKMKASDFVGKFVFGFIYEIGLPLLIGYLFRFILL